MSSQVLTDFEETLNIIYVLKVNLTEFAWAFITFPVLYF